MSSSTRQVADSVKKGVKKALDGASQAIVSSASSSASSSTTVTSRSRSSTHSEQTRALLQSAVGDEEELQPEQEESVFVDLSTAVPHTELGDSQEAEDQLPSDSAGDVAKSAARHLTLSLQTASTSTGSSSVEMTELRGRKRGARRAEEDDRADRADEDAEAVEDDEGESAHAVGGWCVPRVQRRALVALAMCAFVLAGFLFLSASLSNGHCEDVSSSSPHSPDYELYGCGEEQDSSTPTPEGFIFRITESVPMGIELTAPSTLTTAGGTQKTSRREREEEEDSSSPPEYSEYVHTAQAWLDLIRGAQHQIDIACMYLTLNRSVGIVPDQDQLNGHSLGLEVFDALVQALERGVRVQIAQSISSLGEDYHDPEYLRSRGASVRYIPMDALIGGILHTKFIVADRRHFYLGSANMDWRSLSQVKELGITVLNAPCMAADLLQIFHTYWLLGTAPFTSAIPSSSAPSWSPPAAMDQRPTLPDYFEQSAEIHRSVGPLYNRSDPLLVTFPGDRAPSRQFFTSAPPLLRPSLRDSDLDVIVDLIQSVQAGGTISLSFMDYLPMLVFTADHHNRYWPDIDNAIRTAATVNKVNVRMLISEWDHSRAEIAVHLNSLTVLPRVQVKRYRVPAQEGTTAIPYTRVNHAKFMLLEDQLSHTSFISTSNW